MTVILALKCESSTLLMSIPSIKIDPSAISTILLKLKQIVDLPAPVLPTTPIFSPGLAWKVNLSRTTSVVGLYFKTTSENLISPLEGQFPSSICPSPPIYS